MLRWISILVLAVCLPSVGWAQDRTVSEDDMVYAKQLFQEAARLYDEGRYEEAIQAWEESYVISGYTVLLVNIAQAWERLERYDEAKGTWESYLAHAEPEEIEIIKRKISMLEHRIVMRDSVDQSNNSMNTGSEKTGVAPLAVASYSMMGAGLVGIGVGAGFNIAANGSMASIKQNCVAVENGRWMCTTNEQEHVANHDQSATVAMVSYGVGGALFATGLTLALWRPWSRPVQVSADVLPGGGMLRVAGRF